MGRRRKVGGREGGSSKRRGGREVEELHVLVQIPLAWKSVETLQLIGRVGGGAGAGNGGGCRRIQRQFVGCLFLGEGARRHLMLFWLFSSHHVTSHHQVNRQCTQSAGQKLGGLLQ